MSQMNLFEPQESKPVFIHKLSGQRMTIKRDRGTGVVSCWLIDEPQVWNRNAERYEYRPAVCIKENLIPA